MINKKALVVLSGGQDSITCLGWALKMFQSVEAISFDYGQKHKVELECACKVCIDLLVPQKVIKLDFLPGLVTSALTGDGEVGLPHAYKPGLPSSFVPNRNALFLTIAHAYAQEIGAEAIVTGVCQTDYSGYPDCRDIFVQQLNLALNIGYQTNIQFLAPLMWADKADTFALADELGFLSIVLESSHTCYNGNHTTAHPWGYGCGQCPACDLRAKGYWEFNRREETGELPVYKKKLEARTQGIS